MKGLIMNDLFSLRKLLRSVAMVFVFFMMLWSGARWASRPRAL